jgi:hypothetical protein
MANWKEISEVQVGDLATESIGSDSYGRRVVHIDRFKSGKRAGEVKYVWVDRLDGRKRDFTLIIGDKNNELVQVHDGARRFYASQIKVCRHIKSCDCNKGYEVVLVGNGWWNHLSIGQAVDYSDPSF